ncbi:MAG: LuxR C-terminal-related transcriptional regulator, partial [Lachnospiraceae bacterium]|nr:LuxR C-terminal-related transcriptional regulator [Lachnospiraceae bacterium]
MKVALIGLNCLQSHGLYALINKEYTDCEVSIYETPSASGWQQADCHIVSAAALAVMARFLMPRLDRVLLVTTSAQTASPMQMVSPLANETELLTALSSLFDKSKNLPCRQPSPKLLTSREIDVLRLTASGATSKQIADTLCISQN